LQSALPPPLHPHLDLFDGKAWLGIVPFWMSGVRLRGMPPVPGLSRFAELNVRTYVQIDGKPGVYFFSLDAENLPAVLAARLGFGLRYFYARMSVSAAFVRPAAYSIGYWSHRRGSSPPAIYDGSYGPSSETIFQALPGTLEHFLIERYCLYSVSGRKISRCDIHHAPWPLQNALCKTTSNTVAEADGIKLPCGEPLLHYAQRLKVLVWLPTRVR